ncbi:hypothetical protein I79_006543 [Cricetulus griseus]|uniref:Uncharacterized protein n=1 Tax=Cricetulus griseus TaxID=10029 RepID=G3H845_CRIGR|nr:hypothetical protein I79_006543 [Cricetulus griseus]
MTALCQIFVHGAKETTRQVKSAGCPCRRLDLGSQHSQLPCNSVTPAPGVDAFFCPLQAPVWTCAHRHNEIYTYK